MGIENFSTIAVGATFVVDGEAYTKNSELTFRGTDGLERYIDPLFDAKLGRSIAGKAAPTAPQVDVSAKIEKLEE